MKTSKKIIGTLAIPVIVAAVLLILCAANGKSMIANRTSFNYFTLYTAIVMITTMALSINLGSGRFDFSLGAMAVLASILSSKISYALLAGGTGSAVLMLCLNIVIGGLLGLCSGALYVTLRIPPIITSLGVTLIYEGISFTVTGGKYVMTEVRNASMTAFAGNWYFSALIIVLVLAFIVYLFDHTRFGYDYKALQSGQKVAVNTGIREVPNALWCYVICGALMGPADVHRRLYRPLLQRQAGLSDGSPVHVHAQLHLCGFLQRDQRLRPVHHQRGAAGGVPDLSQQRGPAEKNPVTQESLTTKTARATPKRSPASIEGDASMIDLRAKPFFLNDEDIRWVLDTLASMTLEQKAGQVFCPMGFSDDPGLLHHMLCDLHVGGMMYRPGPAAYIQNTHRTIQSMAKIPLLLAANTENGGNGLAFEGTSFGQPMAVAATDDSENAYRMGYTACAEGAALGLNWSFAPIVDINYEFHNPITNVRTFGSDVERVIACGSAYMRGAKENGVAVSIKHFPGDGVDERDQHILTSVNALSRKEWDASFGKVYSNLIEQGAETVMVGHIALPAYASESEKFLPASLSKSLLTGLLRQKLGFNGLISTDATPMVGFTAAMPREKAIPTAIEAGADMILFNKDLDEDYRFLLAGIESGILSKERLDEAVTRILATKAALRLHEKQKTGTLVPGPESLSVVGCEKHRAWAKEVAQDAVTLVKDTQQLLPLSTQKYRRVYLNVIQKDPSPDNPVVQAWKELFEQEGFEVTVRDRRVSITVQDMSDIPSMSDEKKAFMHEMYRSIGEVHQDYDLYVYICNMENASNNTTLRLNWNVTFGLGDDAPWFVSEVPALMISTAYPYHLFDAPMLKTYVNAYAGTPDYQRAVMDKLMGRSPFKGKSPIDPFCGREELKL